MDVTVHGPLRGVTGSKTLSISGFDGDPTVREVLDCLADAHPRTEPHLFADDGTVRGSVRVLLDGETAELDATCPATADVGIVPAVRGGRRPEG
ncbi:ThiS family protein [Halopelagius inordinatus]|uniref:ThiS family protein n=1 Tax=Halopelagius inordinatus TaxID=553467 RepID=A0A1I2P8C7_9EURY|nr:ubiquitin-like small modifier protein 1 [Halopelagius inordinatus]SFG12395.1 ThiS family protein [Halopelagius inordinatus]